MIYLDNAATTYPKPKEVYEALDLANRQGAFNAGRGSYKVAREAVKLVDETKKLLLQLTASEGTGKVAFTPSITIALNEIMQGIDFHEGDNLYISPYEHNAVARTAELIRKEKGINIIQMPLIRDSLEIDVEQLKYEFTQKHPKAVCCIHVSNVTGYVLPVEEIFQAADEYNAITVLDTAQSLGIISIDTNKLRLDYLAFAGHKSLYGPLGIGGFIELRGPKIKPVFAGGTGSNSLVLDMPSDSPSTYEFASLNIVAVAGLNAALKCLPTNQEIENEKALLTKLINGLKEITGVKLFLPPEERHVGVLSFDVSGYKAEDIGMILDEDFSIAVRTGYHCAPFIHSYLKDIDYLGTIRVGIGRYTCEKDIDALVDAIGGL